MQRAVFRLHPQSAWRAAIRMTAKTPRDALSARAAAMRGMPERRLRQASVSLRPYPLLAAFTIRPHTSILTQTSKRARAAAVNSDARDTRGLICVQPNAQSQQRKGRNTIDLSFNQAPIARYRALCYTAQVKKIPNFQTALGRHTCSKPYPLRPKPALWFSVPPRSVRLWSAIPRRLR